jgi:hypothetical protein
MTDKTRLDNMGRAATELLGECIVARRKLQLVATTMRNALAEGGLDYELGTAAIREVRDTGRYLTAQAVQIETDIQPKLPGLGGPGD